ncbi:MAG: tetratricopeptide repeat protein [Acidobacteriota bacterium]
MTSLRIRIFTALFCISIVIFGGQAWASGHAAAGPCPARPAIANELQAGKYNKTIAVLQQELTGNPDDAQAALWLARSYLDVGQYDQAVNFAERAVSLSPQCSESHFWLARSYGIKAERTRSFWLARKSKEEYQTAVRLNPDNLEARRDLMEFYLEAPWILGGSKDKAWGQVKAIASRNAMEGDLARAEYWRDLNKPALAAQEYRKVMAAKPQHAEAYFQVADFYESASNPDEVEAATRAASLIVPGDPRLDYYSAVASVMKGQSLAKAEHDLKAYLVKSPPRDDFPSHAAAHDWLARIYEKWGKNQEAIGQYREALQLSPDNAAAHDALRRLDAN